ncbi:hypothetical protein [Longimicrobium sp.]|uniref:hypothetical protein n=1 Tax=Longimicrobium sp. TaxID=2029185 RepID=UPI002CB2B8BB|nr:hypothetical protein [Longimicrobium sp.]HSU17698.1 hypothetical protein [Longimicrobium sp.]
MDRNDSNPGMVEREMDETPMRGDSSEREEMSGSPSERDHLQRDGQVEREGMQGDGQERDAMRGSEMERDGMGGMEGSRHGRMASDDMEGSSSRSLGDGAMEGMSSSDRESMQGAAGMQGDMGTPSDSLGAGNTNANDAQMRSSGREGGYGYDRPADVEGTRDTMEGSSRDTGQGTDRERPIDGSDRGTGTTTARDW